MSRIISSPEEVGAVISAVANFRASHYLAVSGVTVLVYDYLLCLPTEVSFSSPIRRAQWLTMDIDRPCLGLAFIPSYNPLLHDVAAIGTTELYGPPILLPPQAITYIPATWILCIRVLALYQSSRWLRYLVYGSLCLTHLASLAVGSVAIESISDSISYNRTVRECTSHPPRLLGGSLLVLLPIEILLVFLQLMHSIRHRQFLEHVSGVTLPILNALYIDGTMYFILVFALRLWAGLMLAIGTDTLFFLPIFAEYAFTSIAISRLFLHLRIVARRHLGRGDMESTEALTSASISRVASPGDPFARRRPQSSLILHMPVIERRTEIP
ncbi:hypothetical protein M408DRAFT_22400 [Serendipita vermifera MAFF 305830]|uniref:G-protein coupled receptors family 1 profile domain-containing protein n=1 Tax=Serendipita vermifera MAFF 305830 TaxID=933852 RepID=A0A0C3AZK0_SERVB|nr:hypothetical protein M408DRAFT_22400 [Serendipita vermifera MAFF 305830]